MPATKQPARYAGPSAGALLLTYFGWTTVLSVTYFGPLMGLRGIGLTQLLPTIWGLVVFPVVELTVVVVRVDVVAEVVVTVVGGMNKPPLPGGGVGGRLGNIDGSKLPPLKLSLPFLTNGSPRGFLQNT